MSALLKLASSVNRRDELPNQELAEQIVKANDKRSVKEIIENLNNKNKGIQSDCIKVITEIGERKPDLIAEYAKELLALLGNKTNRLQWGAMAALDSITPENPKFIFSALPTIIQAANNGSVITKDHAVGILIKLCSFKQYAEKAFTLLIEQLKQSATNQLPMYAERALPVISEKNKNIFVQTLRSRLRDIEKESQLKRVEKVIAKLVVNKK